MKNIPIQKIAQILDVKIEKEFQVLGYQIDSRLVEEGELFFALVGEKVDGHQYLADVAMRRAAAAVVEKSYSGEDFGLELIRVDDVLKTLQKLAREMMKEAPPVLVGVTGSVGKTTTKEFIAMILAGKFKTGKSERSFNSKRTFPLSLLNREAGLEVLVVEMGMSDPGDIAALVDIAAPDIGVLTKVALAHAVHFPGGIEEIARNKAAIFGNPKTKQAIFPHELSGFEGVVEAIGGEKVSFSLERKEADYFLSEQEEKFLIDERGIRAYGFDLPFKQSHILHDFLAAVSVARTMKMSWDEIHHRVKFLELPKMRFEQFEKGEIVFVNDTYNANPESMRAALAHIPTPREGGKKIAVLGSMCDLGVFSEGAHQEMGRFAQKYIDHLLAYGNETTPLYEAFQEVKKPAELFADQESLVRRLKEVMSPGDVVLVKGSRAMKMENVFALLD